MKSNRSGRFNPRQIIILLLGAIAVFSIFMFIVIFVAQFTMMKSLVSPTSVALEIPEKNSELERKMLDSLQEFLFQTGADTLKLDEKDFHHLIRNNKKLVELESGYKIEFTDSSAIVYSSIPVEKMQGVLGWLTRLLGRKGYINSEMNVAPVLTDSSIKIKPIEARMRKQEVPLAGFMKNQGLDVATLVENPSFWRRLRHKLQHITIRDQKLLLIK